MTALLESLSWWPWAADATTIRQVRQQTEAPGMVTLRWRTEEPVPSLLTRVDGTPLFRDADLRQHHQVTLTGWAGLTEQIVICAGPDEHTIAVAF